MTPFFLGVALIAAAGVIAGMPRRPAAADRAFALLVSAGCVLASVPAVRVLGGTLALSGGGGTWVFGIDLLSAAFVPVVLAPGLASAWYGMRSLGLEREHRPVGVARALFSLELAALALVVTARGVVPFLAAWEVMAVLSYFLVIFEHERAEVRRAGFVYLVATHTGTLALIAMFAYWAGPSGAMSFDTLAARAVALPAGGAVVLWLALIGFGLKAGIVPLHFWLPDAHASAPSHVSALMSGIVIKMGVYGLFRVVMLLATPPAWWGWLVLALGVVSGVLGVLWALAQHDLKRLLAYHSVENIGIILMGLGAGALGITYHVPLVAVLGFAGAILHTLNHALFKSLLFLGAGTVAHATGTRALDRLGGLARRMPLTWIAFLVGSAAIVGLPPLNGFVSEWLVYQALLGGGTSAGPIRLTLVGIAGLALVGGLALACFAKVCGIVFLGNARSAHAEHGHEAPKGLLGPMFALAAGCALIGLAPALAVRPAIALGSELARVQNPVGGSGVLEALTPIAMVSLTLVALLGIGSAVMGAVRRRRPVTEADTWGCGYALPNARMQYTASSFAAPLLATYGPLVGVREESTPTGYHSHARELVLDGLILPAWEGVRGALWRLRPIQLGRLWVYLLYIIVVLALLLLYIGVAGGPVGVAP